jgi:L-iditol 2-dehydrogenase
VFYTPPITLGHEYAGVISEVGSKVLNFKVGDKVTSPATIPCEKCFMCKTNHANRCIGKQKRILGCIKTDGTFAKYVAVPSKILHKIPKNLSFDESALAETVACAIHFVTETVKIILGDVVVVLGPGSIGLLSLQVAKISGAEKIIVIGKSEDKDRLKLAEKLGAEITINVDEEDPIKTVKTITKGLGADVVLEASGASVARKQAFDLVRRCGKLGLIGLTGKSTDINLDKVVEGELDVKGSWGTIWTSWKKALSLIDSRKIKVAPLITDKLPLDRWFEGFKMMEERKALKVLLIPS